MEKRNERYLLSKVQYMYTRMVSDMKEEVLS